MVEDPLWGSLRRGRVSRMRGMGNQAPIKWICGGVVVFDMVRVGVGCDGR